MEAPPGVFRGAPMSSADTSLLMSQAAFQPQRPNRGHHLRTAGAEAGRTLRRPVLADPYQAMIGTRRPAAAVLKAKAPGNGFAGRQCAAAAGERGSRPAPSCRSDAWEWPFRDRKRSMLASPGAKLAEFVEALRTMRATTGERDGFLLHVREGSFRATAQA